MKWGFWVVVQFELHHYRILQQLASGPLQRLHYKRLATKRADAMKTTASIKRIAYVLESALVALCFCQPAPAQSTQSRYELPSNYTQWLDEDVRWIITPQERRDFRALSTVEDRDRFMERFWKRRDPTPGTPENEFKEEHYRRIEYANIHFGWDKVPGWETDRGRIYIRFGPPDEIKQGPFLVSESSAKRTEVWYFDLTPKGKPVSVRFVDFCKCGDYRFEPAPVD